jgi:hypothetical protein
MTKKQGTIKSTSAPSRALAAPAPRRTVASTKTTQLATEAIRKMLPDLEAGEEPITHTLLQKRLREQGIPASVRTYWSYVTEGSDIALQIKRAQDSQQSPGTALARAREDAKKLRARIAELEEANRTLLAQQAAMVAYLADDKDGPGLDVTVVHRMQRASLGEVVRGTAFARRPLASFGRSQSGGGRGRQ